MPRTRNHRKSRRRFFVACEGESEAGYAALIQRLADDAKLPIHLDIRKYRGGDSLKIVSEAVRELQVRKYRRGEYSGQAIFLDADRLRTDGDRKNEAVGLIEKYHFHPIWSNPSFEALLLKHLNGCEFLQPSTANLALKELRSRWPNYRKGMAAYELSRELDLSAVLRAAEHLPDLREFLVSIGLYK